MIAASCRRSTVHHHSLKGVRCSREIMGGPNGRRSAHWSPMMVSRGLTNWKCFEGYGGASPLVMPGLVQRLSGTVCAFMPPSRLLRKRDWRGGVELPGSRTHRTQIRLVVVRASIATALVEVQQLIV